MSDIGPGYDDDQGQTGYDADRGGNFWDHARREYLSGVKATIVCQRYGISLSSFRLHARAGRWRRIDQPGGDIPPEPGEYHREDQVSFADLADEAFLNIRRALGTGRAGEAGSWMRLYDKLADRARAEVMSDLPDAPPPPPPPEQPPIRLTLIPIDDDDVDIEFNALDHEAEDDREELDSLDSVFSESNPVVEAAPDGPADPPALDLEALRLLRRRRLELGLSVADLDAVLDQTPDGRPQPANPP